MDEPKQMPVDRPDTDPLQPYQYPNPPEALPEIVVPHAIPTDERLWVPQAENVWFRPLCLNASQGYWMNLLKVRKSGVLSRHRHPQALQRRAGGGLGGDRLRDADQPGDVPGLLRAQGA